jgi:hypothetical protein
MRSGLAYIEGMKTYQMTLTEEQANTIGYALMQTMSREKAKDKTVRDDDMIARLAETYRNLDTCPELETA